MSSAAAPRPIPRPVSASCQLSAMAVLGRGFKNPKALYPSIIIGQESFSHECFEFSARRPRRHSSDRELGRERGRAGVLMEPRETTGVARAEWLFIASPDGASRGSALRGRNAPPSPRCRKPQTSIISRRFYWNANVSGSRRNFSAKERPSP